MFNFKKMFQNDIKILAPVKGEAVPISEVSDPTFGEEILGKGIAIKPEQGKVVSPVKGTVVLMIDTGHAVSLLSDDGVEILIHIGLDTVQLKGQHFTTHAKTGDKVNVGDLLIEFDVESIKQAGYDVITPVVICNTADFKEIHTFAGKPVQEGDEIISVVK